MTTERCGRKHSRTRRYYTRDFGWHDEDKHCAERGCRPCPGCADCAPFTLMTMEELRNTIDDEAMKILAGIKAPYDKIGEGIVLLARTALHYAEEAERLKMALDIIQRTDAN